MFIVCRPRESVIGRLRLLYQIVGAAHIVQPVGLDAYMLHAAHVGNADVSKAVGAAVAAVELRLGIAVLAHFCGVVAQCLLKRGFS